MLSTESYHSLQKVQDPHSRSALSTYVCMYVCMYVCIYNCTYIYILYYIYIHHTRLGVQKHDIARRLSVLAFTPWTGMVRLSGAGQGSGFGPTGAQLALRGRRRGVRLEMEPGGENLVSPDSQHKQPSEQSAIPEVRARNAPKPKRPNSQQHHLDLPIVSVVPLLR